MSDLGPTWTGFLQELDSLLDEPVQFHCIGGFAAVAKYGLPRGTNDLDYFSLVSDNRMRDLQEMAGEGSPLARKHKVHVHHAGVATLPENYEERMKELLPGQFKNICLFVLDPYDLVLSKLSRNIERDREDVKPLVSNLASRPKRSRARYDAELKPCLIGPPERHDATLEFWLEAYFGKS